MRRARRRCAFRRSCACDRVHRGMLTGPPRRPATRAEQQDQPAYDGLDGEPQECRSDHQRCCTSFTAREFRPSTSPRPRPVPPDRSSCSRPRSRACCRVRGGGVGMRCRSPAAPYASCRRLGDRCAVRCRISRERADGARRRHPGRRVPAQLARSRVAAAAAPGAARSVGDPRRAPGRDWVQPIIVI